MNGYEDRLQAHRTVIFRKFFYYIPNPHLPFHQLVNIITLLLMKTFRTDSQAIKVGVSAFGSLSNNNEQSIQKAVVNKAPNITVKKN